MGRDGIWRSCESCVKHVSTEKQAKPGPSKDGRMGEMRRRRCLQKLLHHLGAVAATLRSRKAWQRQLFGEGPQQITDLGWSPVEWLAGEASGSGGQTEIKSEDQCGVPPLEDHWARTTSLPVIKDCFDYIVGLVSASTPRPKSKSNTSKCKEHTNKRNRKQGVI